MSLKPPSNPTDTFTSVGLDARVDKLEAAHFDVTDYGALTPATTARTTIRAACDAAAALGTNAIVYIPRSVSVDCTAGPCGSFGPSSGRVEVHGPGVGNIIGATPISGIRVTDTSAGTNPIFEWVGTGDTATTRAHGGMRNIELSGNGTKTGYLLKLWRASETILEDVRLHNSPGGALTAQQWWNSMNDRLYITSSGTGTTTPAMLIDSTGGVSATPETNTVHFTSCEFEGNTGTDMRIKSSAVRPTVAITFTNIKMETVLTGAASVQPFIDIDNAHTVMFVGGFIHKGGGSTGVVIQQQGTAPSTTRVNSFIGVNISNDGTTDHWVEMSQGAMAFIGCGFNGTPVVKYIHAAVTVASDALQLWSNYYATTLRIKDDRAAVLGEIIDRPLAAMEVFNFKVAGVTRSTIGPTGLITWFDGGGVADTTLARGGAKLLQSDSEYRSARALAADTAFTAYVASVQRWSMVANGFMTWYDSAGVAEGTVSRPAANQLQVGTADFLVGTVGKGLRVKEGSNAKQGVSSAMVAGTITVANTSITASSRLLLTRQAGGTNPGAVYESTRTAGTSFVVTSTNAGDTGTVAYQIFEPA